MEVIESGTTSLQEVETELREKLDMLISLVKPKHQKVYVMYWFVNDYYRNVGVIENKLVESRISEQSYESRGVDIDKGNQCVTNIKTMVEETYDMNVFRNYGGFGGVYNIEFIRNACREPLLVTSMIKVQKAFFL